MNLDQKDYSIYPISKPNSKQYIQYYLPKRYYNSAIERFKHPKRHLSCSKSMGKTKNSSWRDIFYNKLFSSFSSTWKSKRL